MPFDPFKHKRRSIRLPGYDYSSPGGYYITIDSHHQEHIFGEIVGGEMRLNQWGAIAESEWLRTPELRSEIELDVYQIMPNHIHGILFIRDAIETVGARRRMEFDDCRGTVGAHGRAPLRPEMPRGPANKSLGALIAGYKSSVTTHINQSRGTPGAPIWQRDFYDHIIRDEHDLSRIRQYIRNNPAQWEWDEENKRR